MSELAVADTGLWRGGAACRVGAFWILTGPWARLLARVEADPAIALVVDVCDLATGLVHQVIAAEILPFDVPRGRRKLTRYLGADESKWDGRFRRYLYDDPAGTGTTWLRLLPTSLTAKDLSYTVYAASRCLLSADSQCQVLMPQRGRSRVGRRVRPGHG